MGSDRAEVRLRQAVLAVAELEPAVSTLRAELGLGEPFRDPGVGEFGLSNAVFALGDGFLELVSPVRAGTAAGRFLERGGGGYMVIFDLRDLDSARDRVAALGIRVVWQIDLPDISGTHLHPGDMGTITSLDSSRPFGSWRWGGPEWTGRTGTGAPGRVAGVTIAVADPAAAVARWADVLGASAQGTSVVLDDGWVRFVAADNDTAAGLSEIAVELPAEVRRSRDSIEFAGARLRLLDAA